MRSLARTLACVTLGSIVAGTVLGVGFAFNFRGEPGPEDEKRRRKLGPQKRFDLGAISGSLIHHARPSPTIVFIHGRSANWSETFPMAQRFYAEGYNVALWGRAGRTIRYGREGVEDVLRVVRHVQQCPEVDSNRIFVIGLSLGAAMALGAAAEDDQRSIAAVIADSPYGNLTTAALRYVTAFGCIPKFVAWPTALVMLGVAKRAHRIEFKHCNPVDWARRIRCPVLLIHGAADWRIPPDESRCIFDQIASRKDLWLVEGAGHTQAFARNPHEYVRRLKNHFERAW